MRRWWVLLGIVGCDDAPADGGGGPEDAAVVEEDGGAGGGAGGAGGEPACEGVRLVAVAVDAWGRSPPGAFARGAEPAQVAAATSWNLEAGAPGHTPLAVSVAWSGEPVAEGLTVEGATYAAVAFDAEAACPTYEVFLGLEHTWFDSTARPWHTGNEAELFTESAAFWQATSQALRGAQASIFWTTWWWQSDMDLLRNPDKTPEERVGDTALGHLEAKAGLLRRVLVNQFLGGAVPGAENLTIDAPLRAHGRDPADGIEVMAHTNEVLVPAIEEYMGPEPVVDFVARLRARPEWADRAFLEGPLTQALEPSFEAASFHGKGTIIDGTTAFVQGHNTQDPYWDTSAHAVFDARRMPATADAAARGRVAVRAELPEFRPFQDYALRVTGPVVGELEALYALAWNHARAVRSAFFEDTTAWEPGPGASPRGSLAVQIQATVPPPFTEQSVLSGQRRAIAQARRYILVEDQYWRATRLIPDFVAALEQNPELVVIVVTNEIDRTDGGKHWTYVMDQALRTVAPDRYLLLQRRVFDLQKGAEAADGRPVLHDVSVYNHAKLMLVDDVWLSVGSANKNNRSLLYDGEVNAVVLDEAFTSAARRRILADWVGPVRTERLSDDMAANLAVLRDTAAENATIVQAWRDRWPTVTDADIDAERSLRPFGTVFPYVPDDDFLLDVGPDLY
jgi:phosphatidylserine/phosphatidylglycerophosphate/cardiolipin synthase-like enzyme